MAALVFEDARRLIYPERVDGASGEQRWHAIGRVELQAGFAAGLLVVHVYREEGYGEEIIRIISARRQRSLKSEDIARRKWSEGEKRAMRGIAERPGSGDDSRISFKEIPPLSAEQLAGMVRLRERRPKVSVSVGLDARVVEWLKGL